MSVALDHTEDLGQIPEEEGNCIGKYYSDFLFLSPLLGTGLNCMAQVDLQLNVLLPQPPAVLDYRCVTPL